MFQIWATVLPLACALVPQGKLPRSTAILCPTGRPQSAWQRECLLLNSAGGPFKPYFGLWEIAIPLSSPKIHNPLITK
jgi:hypothetical protein